MHSCTYKLKSAARIYMHHRAVTDQHIFARNIPNHARMVYSCVCMHTCTHLAFKELIYLCYDLPKTIPSCRVEMRLDHAIPYGEYL